MSVDSSMSRTTPVPPQVGHAPPLLKARSSAEGPEKSTPQVEQVMGSSAATFRVGAFTCPLGHTWQPRRENMRRR